MKVGPFSREYDVLMKYKDGGVIEESDVVTIDELSSVGLITKGIDTIAIKSTARTTDLGRKLIKAT